MKQITIENYRILEKKPLQNGDLIRFDVSDTDKGSYEYIVKSSWLGPLSMGICETEILKYLIENKKILSIMDYLRDLYGYEPIEKFNNTTWPDCHDEDYAALTRVVIDIFDKLLGVNPIPVIPLTELDIQL